MTSDRHSRNNNDDNNESTALIKNDLFIKRQRPDSYRNHFYWLFSSLTALVSYKFINGLARLVTVSVVGHLGSQELAGMSLAQMLESCTTLYLALGLTSALDTLCGQAWTGAKDKTIIGLYIQRSIMIYITGAISICIFWILCLKYLMNDGSTDEAVIRYAGIYILFFIPGIVTYAGYHIAGAYLQAQGIMRVGGYGALLSIPVTIAANYLLVVGKPFELGPAGAALADSTSSIIMLIIMMSYIIFNTKSQAGWGGWHIRHALQDWGPIIRLCIPTICLHLLMSGIPQLCTLAISHFGETYSIAAHFILLKSSMAFHAFAHGLKHAMATRIGNLMGQGSLADVKRAIVMSSVFAFCLATVSSTLLIVWRREYPSLYTKDEDIAQVVSKVLPILALQLVGYIYSNLAIGICDGLGRQRITVTMAFIAYFILGIPTCYFFAFTMKWAVLGLWIGLMIAEFIFAILLFIHLYMLNWSKELYEIEKRIKKG
ncbi:hypothetical protein INT45_003792 [Circinella minor]|uniref:MATE efflux family protein n=1 Tax=Circinella minor TaxID=1195481 RepID=A0A8H7RVV9_9FUNG|nr:hypothetical protein INT45_003792 [Circinella minor]